MREGYGEFLRHAAGIGGEHQDAVAHQHRFLDVVRHHQHRFHRQLLVHPQVDQVGSESLGSQHVERGEGLVHEQQIGMHDQRACQAHALAHAARHLLRVGAFVAAKPDEIDRLLRALLALGPRHALRFQPDFHILLNGKPGKQRKTLEHHGHALGRARQMLAAPDHLACGRPQQPRHDAQQGALAGSGTSQQADDLAGSDADIDIVENDEVAG